MKDIRNENSPLDRSRLRADLATLDARQKKIVGGMMAILFKEPHRVREQEWLAEQFTEVTLLAGEFEAEGHAQDVVTVVQDYVRANITPLLDVCIRLFQCVGEDLAPRLAEGVDHNDAILQALSYFS